jgi:hypothetical protein
MTVEEVVFQVNHRSFSSATEAQLNDLKLKELLSVAGLQQRNHVFRLRRLRTRVQISAGFLPGFTAKEGTLSSLSRER